MKQIIEYLPCNREAKSPAGGGNDRGGYAFHFDGEQLSNDGPGDGAQAHAVGHHEHNHREDGQEADGLRDRVVLAVEEEEHP